MNHRKRLITVSRFGALSSRWIDAMPIGSRSRSSRTNAQTRAVAGNAALSQFIGPRAEQAEFVEQLLVRVFRDHMHWRKNYQSDDPTLVDASRCRQFEPGNDRLTDAVDRMTAALRGSFPFHSPRYIAHQLSEVSIPALLGFLTTLLYNPNNVTPEAAPVTTHWEIDACAEVLAMLGFARPPAAVATDTRSSGASAPSSEFGWCHITSGGTLSNIEALWVARVVRYFPLAARDVARDHALPVAVRMPDGTVRDLRTLSPIEAVSLRPAEAIQLLPDLVDAVRRSAAIPSSQVGPAAEETWRLLRESPYSPSASTGKMFAEFPAAVLASGAAHYSILKAADVLGIGRDNVVLVDVDILQRAPYITSATHAPGLVDLPPRRHERGSDGRDLCVIDAFAPFVLEGSRPGAAAGALWLASTVLPFTMREHGAVVRESLIGAIELYEWLRRWEHIAMVTGGASPYRIVPLTATRPDTNIVLFTVTEAHSRSLTSMNEITTQVERGDRRASYAQPFFLSSTRLASPNYRYQSVADFLRRAGVDASPDEYRRHDIVVLRATVMNPYLRPLVRERRQPVFEQFMKALDDAARAAVTTSRRDREAGRGRSGTGQSPAVEKSAERTARSR